MFRAAALKLAPRNWPACRGRIGLGFRPEALRGRDRRVIAVPKRLAWDSLPVHRARREALDFSHLQQRQHPFTPVIDSDVEVIDLAELASTDEGHRRTIALLNRAVGRYLGMQGVRFDREHQRYWFLADRDYDTGQISERAYRYTTKTGRSLTRPVVHHAHRRGGEARDEWYHEAVRLRFERFGATWFLTVRPEFHITVDGIEPLPSHRVGRKITRKKSHLYNDGYLDRLWFWKHFLSKGGPRLPIKTGEQSILVEAGYATSDLRGRVCLATWSCLGRPW